MYSVKCWLDDFLKGKGEMCWLGRMKKTPNKPGKRSVTSWFQRMLSSDSNVSLPHSISHSHVTSSASVSWIWYGSNHISNVEVCCQLGTEIPELQHLKVLKFEGRWTVWDIKHIHSAQSWHDFKLRRSDLSSRVMSSTDGRASGDTALWNISSSPWRDMTVLQLCTKSTHRASNARGGRYPFTHGQECELLNSKFNCQIFQRLCIFLACLSVVF